MAHPASLQSRARGPSSEEALAAGALDPWSPQALADPYPVYQRLREHSPVHSLAPGRWLVSRHGDAQALLEDPRCAHWGQDAQACPPRSPHEGALAEALRLFAPSVPPSQPRHGVASVLNSVVLEGVHQRLAPLADELLAGLPEQGSFDALAQYARPLAMVAVGDMLGLCEAQAARLGAAMARWDGPFFACLRAHGIAELPDGPARQLQACLDSVIEQQQEDSGGALVPGLRAALAPQTSTLALRDRLSNALLVLIYAAHHNMLNFIGNGLLALATQPAAQARWREAPAVERAVLELLRHDSPLQYIVLSAREDFVLRGARIMRGEEVLVCVGSANRDPAVFGRPDTLDFERSNHRDLLSFGSGAWRCMGARLALGMGAVAFTRLVERGFSLAPDAPPLRWIRMPMVQRGVAALPLRLARHG